MRRLGLLGPVSLCLLGSACTKENPAFDDCETDASCVDEDGTRGDGDGDPGDGDGDGDTGDGDGDTGDGDGDTGDGDGDTGDGDGDQLLPTCPDSTWVIMPVLQDTFLDGTSYGGQSCIIDWDFNTNQALHGNGFCPGLDFGASTGHWACGSDTCTSVWLGKFELAEWMQLPVQVEEARLVFTAKYKKGEPNVALAYELDVSNANFGECLEWHAGGGQGDPPSPCATTFVHSAFPNLWDPLPIQQLIQAEALAAADIPVSGDEYVEHTFVMPVEPPIVQNWLSGQTVHHGVMVISGATEPTEFYLFAQGSRVPPRLQARLCLP
jgi:hypothetical protein